MRRFNPDKELYKIQHGKRDKLFIGAFLLLLIISISSTYALYQIRYSKKIIYTKVAPFSNKDIQLAVSLDGKTQPNVPEKGTAYYESITCDNDKSATAGWDYKNWKLGAISVTIPNKCTINFTTHPSTLIDLIDYDYHNNPEMVMKDDTDDNNLRYIGQEPNNYIWFNCDSYDDLNQETAKTQCEKWRIIGFMNNMTVIDGTTQEKIPNQSLVKIIRADSIENIEWDSSNYANWTAASLQTLLRSYYNGSTLNGKKGITSATKSMVEQVIWNLGGIASTYNTAPASGYYSAERESTTWNNQPSTWLGYIGLMYPSDYGYATSGLKDDPTYNREGCLDKELYNWSSDLYKNNCAGNSWLYDSSNSQWTITPITVDFWCVAAVYANGRVSIAATRDTKPVAARPTLYLQNNIQIKNGAGKGSFNEPYILSQIKDNIY